MTERQGDTSSSDWDSSDDEGMEVNVTGSQGPLVQVANQESPGFKVLNEYVMDHMLRFLPVQDLKNCRLVNSSLNAECLKVIPKIRHALRIPSAVRDINRLINVITKSAKFPWAKFELDGEEITTNKQEAAVGRLLGMVAPFATGINISNVRVLPGNHEYPTLKSLKLNVQGDSQKPGLDFGIGILERAPNLSKLKVSGNRLMERFMEVLATPNAKSINHLELCSVIEDKHLVRLSQLDLELKYLNLTFVRDQRSRKIRISSESLKMFLESQSTHLNELELTQVDEVNSCSRYYVFQKIEFPCMDKLTGLKIELPSKYSNISYAELFPVLRKLEFQVLDYEIMMEACFFDKDVQPLETVEELIFCQEVFFCPSYALLGGRQFPNLRKVQLANLPGTLECMSMSMINVEELSLICEDMDEDETDKKDVDPDLCGLSQDAYEELKDWPSSQLKAWGKYVEPPLCLKRLKKLRLIAGERRLRLGEIGCRFGLLKLKRLEILELVGDCSRISAKVMKALRKKFTVIVRD